MSISPPEAAAAPKAKGKRNVAVIGPEATPPESKAMEVKIRGAKKVRKVQWRSWGSGNSTTIVDKVL